MTAWDTKEEISTANPFLFEIYGLAVYNGYGDWTYWQPAMLTTTIYI